MLSYIFLFTAFLILLIEKLAIQKDGKSEYSKFPKLFRIPLIIFQIAAFIYGIYQIINDESEKKSLKTQHYNDSIQAQKRWEYDTTRLSNIINKSTRLLEKSDSALSNSLNIIQNVTDVNLKTKGILKISEANLFPISPINLFLHYQFVVNKKVLLENCPFFSSQPENALNGLAKDSNDIKKLDEKSRNFLLGSPIILLIEKIPNITDASSLSTLQKNRIYLNRFYPYRAAAQKNIITWSAQSIGNSVKIDVFIYLKDQKLNNYIPLRTMGINEIAGWYLNCRIYENKLIEIEELVIQTEKIEVRFGAKKGAYKPQYMQYSWPIKKDNIIYRPFN